MRSCDKSTSYKSILAHYDRSFPNPNYYQIQVDLHRTFPDEDLYKDPHILKSLENILGAYTVRNPTIGYSQGFNFIVGRLLKIMTEEVSFVALIW